MKGSSGAIKDIVVIPDSFVVMTCGYDRFLRIFNYKTYEELPQVYLKNKLNVIYPVEYDSVKEKEEENEEDESDEMFDDDEMEEDEEEGDDNEEDEFDNGSNQS